MRQTPERQNIQEIGMPIGLIPHGGKAGATLAPEVAARADTCRQTRCSHLPITFAGSAAVEVERLCEQETASAVRARSANPGSIERRPRPRSGSCSPGFRVGMRRVKCDVNLSRATASSSGAVAAIVSERGNSARCKRGV